MAYVKRVNNKSAFVRLHPKATPSEVVELASKAGLTLDVKYVGNVRWKDRSEGAGNSARPMSGRGHQPSRRRRRRKSSEMPAVPETRGRGRRRGRRPGRPRGSRNRSSVDQGLLLDKSSQFLILAVNLGLDSAEELMSQIRQLAVA